jgi:hypothetical protein
MESQFKVPTESIELPSKGLLYPEGSALASGKVEMKYMTAKEEDILTNQNYIKNGTVIDRLLKSLIITEGVNYNQLLVGDKNAIMFAARVLSYGKDYTFSRGGINHTVDLSELELKYLDESLVKERENKFSFALPTTGNTVTFKLLTHSDETSIERELTGLKKINKNSSPEVTTRLKKIITSVNGLSEQKDIRSFVDEYLLAKDARALRAEYQLINPDVKMVFNLKDEEGGEEEVDLPIGLNFFWPDA